MKEYLVSEEELFRLLENAHTSGNMILYDMHVFRETHQPVELIASGYVVYDHDKDYKPILSTKLVEEKISEHWYDGKQVKILLEVQK